MELMSKHLGMQEEVVAMQALTGEAQIAGSAVLPEAHLGPAGHGGEVAAIAVEGHGVDLVLMELHVGAQGLAGDGIPDAEGVVGGSGDELATAWQEGGGAYGGSVADEGWGEGLACAGIPDP